jgi:predicted nucleic acid-binding Zn ribbon protein
VTEYKRKPNTKCFLCKKAIYRRPSQIENGSVFCTSACYGIFNRKEIPCGACGKLILSQFNKKTCSRSCANVHRTGIKYHVNQPRNKAKDLRSIKLRLLEFRGKKCERCKYNRVETLQVHHIDRNRKNNSFDNLEIICPNCHYEEHLIKGKV